MSSWRRWVVSGVGVAGAGYLGLVTGALTVDLGLGRRARPLGPQVVEIAAPRDVVFDLIAQPNLGRPTQAMARKIQMREPGTDLELAAHRTRSVAGLSRPRWRRSGSTGPNASHSGWCAVRSRM